MLKKQNFDKDFKWGVTSSAFQNEGAAFEDAKSGSIWDSFTSDIQNINDGNAPGETSGFYQNYKKDIKQARKLGFGVFAFHFPSHALFLMVMGILIKKELIFTTGSLTLVVMKALSPE